MREHERPRWTPWHVLAVLLILGVAAVLLVLIYRVTDGGTAGSTPSQVAAGPTPSASASAGPSTTAASGNAAPSPSATRQAASEQPQGGTPAPATAPARVVTPPPGTPAPATNFSPYEMSLHYSLREDALAGCTPRRADLPPGSSGGIECRPRGQDAYGEGGWDIPETLAERVGVYGFDSPAEAAVAYLDRLERAGVTLGEGDCQRGESADHPWEGQDGQELSDGSFPVVDYFGEAFSANRAGCFLDEDGSANVRVTCGDGVYIGVLGRTADVALLYEWTIQYPPGRLAEDGRPGICVGSDGLIFPDTEP